jgi:gluconolactonase
MTSGGDMATLTDRLRFPEGPIALADGSVLVVEIEGRSLTRVTPAGAVERLAMLEGGPNGAALGPDCWVYICNSGGWTYVREGASTRPSGQSEMPGWIERVHLETRRVEKLYTACGDTALRSPNDIVFDVDGGFYFTDHGKRNAQTMDIGRVYYGHADGRPLIEVATNLVTPNGIGLSADAETLFVAETITRRLWAFSLSAPGVIAPEPWPSPCGGRLVAALGDAAYLDSLAIDAAGNICVASFNRCGIHEISPDGARHRFVELDDFYATNIAFGGPDNRTAFVTLSSSGRLVALPWPRPGLPLSFQDIFP